MGTIHLKVVVILILCGSVDFYWFFIKKNVAVFQAFLCQEIFHELMGGIFLLPENGVYFSENVIKSTQVTSSLSYLVEVGGNGKVNLVAEGPYSGVTPELFAIEYFIKNRSNHVYKVVGVETGRDIFAFVLEIFCSEVIVEPEKET